VKLNQKIVSSLYVRGGFPVGAIDIHAEMLVVEVKT
jgi:hypothetical protein